ncbi:hypothetical protein [Tahibacter sp.]|uniref:hypothetical protein n=1 Tax=Tahibacter sp. TaxID=2056211 RepID=UPI0028C42106|nr:hypothetical protein [Tahibacter sp.]
MKFLEFLACVILPFALVLAWLMPKFSAYVAGPGVLVAMTACVVLVRHLYVVRDGGWLEMAGLVFLWGITLAMYALGVGLIRSGLRRQREHEAGKQGRPPRPAPTLSTPAESATRHD